MANKLKERVVIAGVGCTRFGDLLETPEIRGLSLQELAATAAREALEDAGIAASDVDAVFVGNAMVHSSQLPATYSQLSKWLGGQFKAGIHFEAQCSTTNVGAAMAAMAIASGAYDTVLVVGVETTRTKVEGMSPWERESISHQTTWMWTDMAVDQAYQVPQGYDIFSTYNGLVALGYCRKYGISIEDFDRGMFELCRTRCLHGSLTPKANSQETLEAKAARDRALRLRSHPARRRRDRAGDRTRHRRDAGGARSGLRQGADAGEGVGHADARSPGAGVRTGRLIGRPPSPTRRLGAPGRAEAE